MQEIQVMKFAELKGMTNRQIQALLGIQPITWSQAFQRKVCEYNIEGRYSIDNVPSIEALQRLFYHFGKSNELARALSDEIKIHPLDLEDSLKRTPRTRTIAGRDTDTSVVRTHTNTLIQNTGANTDTKNQIQDTHTKYKTQIQELQNQIQDTHTKYKIQIQELQEILQDVGTKYKDSLKQIQIQDTDIDRYKAQIHQIQEENTRYKAQIQQLENKVRSISDSSDYKALINANRSLDSLKMEYESVLQKLEAAKAEISLWKAQINEMRTEITSLLSQIYDKETEIQKLNFKLSQKDVERDRAVRDTETKMNLTIGDELKKAQIQWRASLDAEIQEYKIQIQELQEEKQELIRNNEDFEKEVKVHIRDKKMDLYESYEIRVTTIISALALLCFMLFQGGNSYDYFILPNAAGHSRSMMAAGAFAFGFSTLGLILTIILPMASEKLADEKIFDLIPVNSIPLFLFTAACVYMNFYVNTNQLQNDASFLGHIGFQSALAPVCEFAFGFVLLILKGRRKEIINLLEYLKK